MEKIPQSTSLELRRRRDNDQLAQQSMQAARCSGSAPTGCGAFPAFFSLLAPPRRRRIGLFRVFSADTMVRNYRSRAVP
jgi:hypothetical protein